MEYNEDIMLYVLQIAEECGKTPKSENISKAVEQFYVKGTEIYECFCEAIKNGFILKGGREHIRLTPVGRKELYRLLEKKENQEREIERHEREKSTLWINKITLIMSIVSISISIFTFGFVIYDRWANPVRINCNSPVNENSPTEYSDQPTDTEHYESDADADVHEN